MYSDLDFFTLGTIEKIKHHTKTESYPVWQCIEKHYSQILKILKKRPMTLTYNDFYYTNLIVSKDNSSAMMFDYNLLGKSYAYSDVRNVISSLNPNARETFLHEYGEIDPLEVIIDDVVSVIVTLYFACRKEQFPLWAKSALNTVETDLMHKVNCLLTQ